MSNVPLRSVESLTDIYGMRFLVRSALDVPIQDGVAEDHLRIRESIPTIKHLLEHGARVIILTHVGRDPKNSTEPLARVLQQYFPVQFVRGVTEDEVQGFVAHMKEGTALLLENLRSYEGEEKNDDAFSKRLASYGDFYVDDAFSVAHRAHASIIGIPKYLPSFAGITFMREYTELSKALTPEHPSLFILGGAKYETKEPLIESYADHYTNLFVGGALANDFLKGKGYEVGESLVSPIDLSKDPIMEKKNILLPVDVVAVKNHESRMVPADTVKPDEKILDIGNASIELLAPYIKEAKTILWNGPLGNYEDGCGEATKACAKLIAQSKAHSIVGGGDTIAAIESLGLSDSFGFVSTAGGAMLEFLEKKTLPGIEALSKPQI